MNCCRSQLAVMQMYSTGLRIFAGQSWELRRSLHAARPSPILGEQVVDHQNEINSDPA